MDMHAMMSDTAGFKMILEMSKQEEERRLEKVKAMEERE
jgi:hypothetical protein